MEQLIKVLPTILRAAEDSDEVRRVACFAAWKHTAGEALNAQAVPIGLEERTLVVAVADQIWQRQLQSMTGQLLHRLNALLGQPLISRIELRIAPEALPSKRESRRE